MGIPATIGLLLMPMGQSQPQMTKEVTIQLNVVVAKVDFLLTSGFGTGTLVSWGDLVRPFWGCPNGHDSKACRFGCG